MGESHTIAGGIVTCLDAISGKVVYRSRLSAGAYFASPVVRGRVFLVFLALPEGAITAIGHAGFRASSFTSGRRRRCTPSENSARGFATNFRVNVWRDEWQIQRAVRAAEREV